MQGMSNVKDDGQVSSGGNLDNIAKVVGLT